MERNRVTAASQNREQEVEMNYVTGFVSWEWEGGRIRVAKCELTINSLVFMKSQLEDSRNQKGISRESRICQLGFQENLGIYWKFREFCNPSQNEWPRTYGLVERGDGLGSESVSSWRRSTDWLIAETDRTVLQPLPVCLSWSEL